MSKSELEIIAALDKARAELDALRQLDDEDRGDNAYPFRDRRSVTDATGQRCDALEAEVARLEDELAHLRCARCDAAKNDTSDNRWCPACEEAWALEIRRFGNITPNEDRNSVLSWAAPMLCLVAVPALALVASANVGAIILLVALAALFAVVYQVVPANSPPTRATFRLRYREQRKLPSRSSADQRVSSGDLLST